MKIFPAIDLIDKKAVRLFKGDYNKVTVYNDNPLAVALDFEKCGAKNIHLVDLQGAKSGVPENIEVIKYSKKVTTTIFLENSWSQVTYFLFFSIVFISSDIDFTSGSNKSNISE